MSGRNILNYTVFDNILTSSLTIQSNGTALEIFGSDPTKPTFSVNPNTGATNITGDLNVAGDSTFSSITVSEHDSGLFNINTTSPTNDSFDLGINCGYINQTTMVKNFTGVIREASDPLKRWLFYDGITVLPTSTVSPINDTTVSSLRINSVYADAGSAAAPSYTFNSDTNYDTGLYLIGQDSLGISAGGINVITVARTSPTSSIFSLGADTAFEFTFLSTSNDSVLSNAISTGSIGMNSTSANDKWLKFYSDTTDATPAYAGVTFSSPVTNYFISNVGTTFKISYRTITSGETSTTAPDYRIANTDLIVLDGTTFTTATPIVLPISPISTITNLALQFNGDNTTGIYRSGAGSVGIVSSGTNILNIAAANTSVANQLLLNTGTISTPSLGFTSLSNVGIYCNTSLLSGNNVSFAINSIDSGKFALNGTIPQLIMPTSGTALLPSYTFTDKTTGFYSPINEVSSGQVALSLGGVETVRFRPYNASPGTVNTSIAYYNSILVYPDSITPAFNVNKNATITTNYLQGNNASFQNYNLIDQNIILLYNFNLATAGTDYSPNNVNATTMGTINIDAGNIDGNNVMKGNVLDLQANPTAAGFLDLSSSATKFASLTNAAISLWFRSTGNTLTTNNTIFNCHNTVNNNNISVVILSSSGQLQVTINSDTGTTLQYNTVVNVNDNLWHHVVIQFGPNSIGSTMFLDGALLSSAASTLTYTSSGNNANGALATNSFSSMNITQVDIGAVYNGSVSSMYYTGLLKDIYITGRVFTTAEISKLYNNTSISTYSINTTILNASFLTIGNAILFNPGSAAIPSIGFTSDANTGIYDVSTGILGITTSGVARASFSSSIFQYNASSFEVSTTNNWLSLNMGIGSTGPKYVWKWANPVSNSHYVSTNHDSTIIVNNWFDFYLSTGTGLGTNNVFRVGQTGTGPNTGLITVFGIQQTYNGSVSSPAYSFSNSTGLGLYRISADVLGVASAGVNQLTIANNSITSTNGVSFNIGSSGTTSSLSIFGIISGNDGINITTGTSALQDITAAGLVTANLGLTVANGQTLNVGTTGTTSPLNVFGLITGINGLIISSGTSSLQAVTAAGLITASVGINMSNGQIFNAGASGTSSTFNLYGSSNITGVATFNGIGASTVTGASVYIAPVITAVTSANNYYYTYLTAPATTGTTTGSAYSFYVAGAPTGSITTPYAAYIASGKTYLGGALQIPTGANTNYVLTSDVNGNATWSNIANTIQFNDGTSASPGIAFAAQTSTGFYRPASGQIGVELAGVGYVLFSTTATTLANGQTLNVGNGGTSSPANIFGLITGSNGLTISSGASALQAVTAAGLVTANLGLTVATGQTVNIGTTGNTSPLNVRGLITGLNGLTIAIGTTSIQVLNASGLITANLGLNILTGQTLNVGTAGTTSPLNVFGLITGSNGLTISSGASALQAITAAGLISANLGITIANGQTLAIGTSGTTSILNVFGSIAANNGLSITAGTSALQAVTAAGLVTANLGLTVATGQTLNVGTTGTTSPLNVFGLIIGSNGLTISAGASALQAVTAAGLITANLGLTLATGQTLNVGTTGTTSLLNVMGLITGANGLTISAGASALQAVTAAGLVTANLGLTVVTGQTLTVGTTGTTSPLNVFGLITGSNGLTISTGASALQAVTAAGLITANLGLIVATGQTLNVGTSGITSILNIFGTSNHSGIATFNGVGGNTISTGSVYIAPGSTTVAGTGNYYYTYLTAPTTTGATTGSAYTFYIAGAPSGTITTPYAVYIAAGKTYIGGALQIPTGASAGYILSSDASGNATWVSSSTTTFGDGTSSLPGIRFAAETGTGFYRPASGQIGVELAGNNYVLFSTTATTLINGQTANIGTSGTTSPLNVFGLITGSNGLTISSGTSALQAVTAAGLVTANLGITVLTGQTANIGTTGTTSPLNVFGLITGSNGLTISAGTTSLKATTITSTSPALAITSTTATSAAILNLVAPLNTSANTQINLGVALSNYNAGQLYFSYAGAGSTANAISLGFFGGLGGTFTMVANSTITYTGLITVATIQSNGYVLPGAQGAYLAWNRTGTSGTTAIMNNLGGGVGGFEFVNCDSSGNVLNVGMSINAVGSCSALLNYTTPTFVTVGSTSGNVSISSSTGTYNFGLPIAAGTTGQYLTSNAGGTMTWSNGYTFTNPVTVTIASGVPITTSITSTISNITGTYLSPNLANATNTQMYLGVAAATNNTGIIQYNYVSTGSASNSLGLGIFGTTNILKISGGSITTITGGASTVSSTSLFVTTSNTGNAYVGSFLAPNVTAGNSNSIFLGQALSNYNSVALGFTYAGAGSTSNAVTLGFYGGLGGLFTMVANSTITYTGSITAATIQSNGYVLPGAQGAYLAWNRTGTSGATAIMNNLGGGAGGFEFVNCNADGSVANIGMTISVTGAVAATGLITANLGLNVLTGQTLNVGTTGTTSPLNAFGLITGTNGLTISSGTTNLKSTSISSTSPALAVNTSTTTSSSNINFLAPSLSTAANTQLTLGVALSNYNAGQLYFSYSGAGSTSNAISLGFFGISGNSFTLSGNNTTTFTGNMISALFQATGYVLPGAQGGYLQWNRTGNSGTTSIMNNLGTGTTGGFEFVNCTSNGTISNIGMTISSAGVVTAPGNITSSATISGVNIVATSQVSGATGSFSGVVSNAMTLSSSYTTPGAQGAYIAWNRTSTGATAIMNNLGGGTGGFEFVNVVNTPTAGTIANVGMTISAVGSCSALLNYTTPTFVTIGSTSGNVSISSSTGTYNLILPTTAGTAGQVLTSNAGGIMTWSSGGSNNFTSEVTVAVTSGTALAISSTSTASNVIATFITPLANATASQILLGANASSNNASLIQYNSVSSGSTSNSLGLGIFGNANILQIFGSGASTFSGALTSTGLITGSAGIAITSTNNVSSITYSPTTTGITLNIFAPNLANGTQLFIPFGISNTNKNCANIIYNNFALGSASNSFGIGFSGVADNIFQVFASQAISCTSSFTAGGNITSSGTISGASGSFSGVVANAVTLSAGYAAPGAQGAYLAWSRTGTGTTAIMNNLGGGTGGFEFVNCNNVGTVLNVGMTIDASGNVGTNGGLTTNAISGTALSISASNTNTATTIGTIINTATSPGTTFSVMAPNITAGNYNNLGFGASLSTGNSGQYYFHYAGSGNASNLLGMSFYGGGPSITMAYGGGINLLAKANLFIDTTSGSTVVGFNSTKVAAANPAFTVYNNSTDRTALFNVSSKGTSSGVDSVQCYTTFSSTGAISSTANFYSGTWTPTLTVYSGVATISYISQVGSYTVYGNAITMSFTITFTWTAANSGYLAVSSLVKTPLYDMSFLMSDSSLLDGGGQLQTYNMLGQYTSFTTTSGFNVCNFNTSVNGQRSRSILPNTNGNLSTLSGSCTYMYA
jgi:hypothetical protein